MSVDIKKTALWVDIENVFIDGPKTIRYIYTGILHTVDKDYDVMKIITLDIVRDYVKNIGDKIILEFMMPLGDYVNDLYPYRGNLEFSIYREALEEGGEISDSAKPIELERYKAVFLVQENRNIKASEYDAVDQQTLNLTDVLNVKLQLMNLSLEPLRIKTVGNNYPGVTAKQLIQGVLLGESQKVLVDGKPAADGVDIVEPDNQELLNQVLIPDGTLISSVPTYCQEKLHGVYNTGIGTYFQTFNGKQLWFVYPLYAKNRFEKAQHKAIIYFVPRDRFPSVERTFKVDGDIVYILATSTKNYRDTGEAELIDQGSGFRMADARAFMNKPAVPSPDGPLADRARLMHESVAFQRSDNLNYAPYTDRGISGNPFAQYSKVNKRDGGQLSLTWENADYTLIHPGMPCQCFYLNGEDVNNVYGEILFNHATVGIDGIGVMAKAHITVCELVLFTERITDGN